MKQTWLQKQDSRCGDDDDDGNTQNITTSDWQNTMQQSEQLMRESPPAKWRHSGVQDSPQVSHQLASVSYPHPALLASSEG